MFTISPDFPCRLAMEFLDGVFIAMFTPRGPITISSELDTVESWDACSAVVAIVGTVCVTVAQTGGMGLVVIVGAVCVTVAQTGGMGLGSNVV